VKREPDHRDGAPPELPRVCRRLRTKTAFSASALWKLGRSTTAAYWCLDTMEPFGPDGRFCHPHECGERRSCYRAADED
jgi:hypothetical protein